MLVRVQAFSSKALFPTSAQVVKLGSCISGYAEPSSGGPMSCQVVGWSVCTPEEWRFCSPMTIPPSFDLNISRIGAIVDFLRFPN